MRSFSNILPNFATNLHLLVDSIFLVRGNQNAQKKQYFLFYSENILTFARNKHITGEYKQ